MSSRIPPLWDYNENGLKDLFLKNFSTHVEKRGSEGQGELPVKVRFLTLDDLEALLTLHKKVITALPDSHIFRSDGTGFMEANLDRRGRTVGAFIEDQLIGYAVISFPKLDSDNLGNLIHIAKQEQLHVAHYDGAAVDPDYRGNRLHRFMNDIRGQYAKLAGYHHLMGTVSPLNPYSLDNHLHAGFEIVNFAVKYNGMDRLIIHKDARNTKTSCKLLYTDEKLIPLNARNEIQELLEVGYRGHKVVKETDGFKVVFSK